MVKKSMLKARFVKINKQNLEIAASIMRESFNYVNQGWSEKESIAYTERILHYNYSYIYMEGGLFIGYLAADIHEDHLFIDAISVLPKYMEKGVGRKIYTFALAFAKKRDISQIKMLADPKSIAYQWYKRLGFKETGWVEMKKEL